MINLKNDYCGIAHHKILERLCDLNKKIYVGYGLDDHSNYAKSLIKKELGRENVDIHFLVGGTITNKIFITHALKDYESVICADTGHIYVHETGAIENTGHKVLIVPNYNGKVLGKDVVNVIKQHTDEHMVLPKMVYISNSTELGTIYNKKELIELSNVCKANNLYLYMDGARLGAALTASTNDLTLKDIVNLVDAFYIGGTKNGHLLGEALIIVNDELKENFRYSIKQCGGMYSKGFVAGIGFEVLFEDKLFFEIAKKENELAEKLYEELTKIGVEMLCPQTTNQIFCILKNDIIEKIKSQIAFEIWNAGEQKTTIRFVTHYMLEEKDIDEVVKIIDNDMNKGI